VSRLTSWLAPRHTLHAHCGLPCGIYDPEQARIEAESCYRMIEKFNASQDAVFRSRAIDIKEQRADLVQHHLDVLWHDYFKPPMLEKVPNLHQLFWDDLIDQVDEAWRVTGGEEKTRLHGRAAAAA